MGRPSTYTPEIAEEICERLAEGESLNAICKQDGFPAESTVRLWSIDDVQGFAAKYARARDIGIDCLLDRIIELTQSVKSEDVAARRLEFDALRWYASKLAPKRYGDKMALTDPNGNKIQVVVRSVLDDPPE